MISKWIFTCIVSFIIITTSLSGISKEKDYCIRVRDAGISIGSLPSGTLNAITDVKNVAVGHTTIIRGENVRTGVTAVLPHGGNIFRDKVPAAVYLGNAFGKLAGSTQVEELGEIETPIVLTNTLSVGTAMSALVRYTLDLPGNRDVRSVNAIVGETNDGYLNDIRGMHVSVDDVIDAISTAQSGSVKEGSVGAGTGTRAFGYKGGIGTSSRIVRIGGDEYTVGVLVQSNYGGDLTINGIAVGRELKRAQKNDDNNGDGSCMIIVATDAPLDARNLKRLAKRALFGLARTGSVMSNGSGDFVIAFSTAYRIPHGESKITLPQLLSNNVMTPLFQGVIEASEESVLNSMFMATTVKGRNGHIANALPKREVIDILNKNNSVR